MQQLKERLEKDLIEVRDVGSCVIIFSQLYAK